jgi:hypothetical protein
VPYPTSPGLLCFCTTISSLLPSSSSCPALQWREPGDLEPSASKNPTQASPCTREFVTRRQDKRGAHGGRLAPREVSNIYQRWEKQEGLPPGNLLGHACVWSSWTKTSPVGVPGELLGTRSFQASHSQSYVNKSVNNQSLLQL